MQTDHETSIKTVSILLNDRGVILDHSDNLHEAGIHAPGSAIGIEFDTLLQHHSNQWAETYRYYRAQGTRAFTLESIVGNPHTPGDLHIRSLRTGNLECLNVLLAAHPKRFREEPVSEILEDPSKISQLFLRLQRVESRLDSYMKHFPGVFFFQRIDFSFQYVSPNFERLLQFPPDRLLRSGSQFLAMIYDQDRDFFVRELRKNADRREAFTLQFRVRKPRDGSVIYLTDVRSPVYSDSGMLLGYEGVWLDTTRQIIAERKLTSSAWKENLAMLTAGLVHDFSNVMAGIYALSELYHASMNPSDRMYEGLGQIKKSSMEARKLVRRIIDINREEAGQKNYHDPKKLICEQIDLLRIIFPEAPRSTSTSAAKRFQSTSMMSNSAKSCSTSP
jgi:PAS domain S-box-containing protein